MKHIFSTQNPAQQYVAIQFEFACTEATTHVQLASWRPGRYELGNFAKNVKGFKVFNESGKILAFEKVTKDCWKIDTSDSKSVKILYHYYAADLNAGSTYLSKNQLYVNPVNCCLYVVGRAHEPIEIQLEIPESFEIAAPLPREGNRLFAKNYDELADSPFICSNQLQHNSYKVEGVQFHLWFNGEVKVNWEMVITDFTKFTTKQVKTFTEFPVEEYHFFFQIVPYRAYHGVEHLNSTVILLGPSYDIFEGAYADLLGVSSHELYHAWNVKAIRPIEMFPYDFTKENYSRLGYLCEGVTTYMGDLHLYKSGVFNFAEYKRELSAQLQKHFDNFGRFQYSVAESSFDTWLDGYLPGAPNRKVSIYTEGCLLAFVTDVFIAEHSKDRCHLDDVMRSLYFDFYVKGKGISEEDYQNTIAQFAGRRMDEIFADFFYGTKPFESLLTKAFDYLGLEITHKPVASYSAAKLGFKSIPQGTNFIAKAIYPGSPAELGGMLLEDEIIAVNSYACNGDMDRWLNYFDNDIKTLTVLRRGRILELSLPEVNRYFYLEYGIQELEKPSIGQRQAFESWSK